MDVEHFASECRDAIRSKLGIREDQLVIVQVGRLMPEKNHVRSVSIAKALQNAGVDFKLLFIEKGQEENQIKELISIQGLEEFVKPLGLRSDIPQLMAAADVMLMPSLFEGFHVNLVESQAAGLPSVISSAISKEVDLGLELVHFVELESPDEHWVSAILKAAKSNVPKVSSRLKVLDAAGYSSSASSKRLEAVYEVA